MSNVVPFAEFFRRIQTGNHNVFGIFPKTAQGMNSAFEWTAENLSVKSTLNRLLLMSAVFLGLFASNASATTFTIDDKDDSILGGVGTFYLVSGNNPASSPGQVTEVLGGPSGTLGTDGSESETRSISTDTLYTLLSDAGFTSASKLVFGFGLNQTGAPGSNYVDITSLTMTFLLPDQTTTKTFDLGGDTVRAYNYAQGGDTAEVRFGVDLGFDFMQVFDPALPAGSLTISSNITHTDDGFEIYFFSTAFTADENPGGGGSGSSPAVPEPASIALFGTGLAMVAQRVRRRKNQA